eukprot:8350675-Pyramimonas_sp.AAC.1
MADLQKFYQVKEKIDEGIYQNVATDMLELTKTQRVDLTEVCCPETSALGQAVLSQGGLVVRCDLFNGYDMATATGLRRAVHLLRRTRPR